MLLIGDEEHPSMTNNDDPIAAQVVLTIGYGGAGLDQLIERLRSAGVTHVADVRTAPFSKARSEFNGPDLEVELKAAGIGYVFLGRELGGRPSDPDCYTSEGRVNYGAVAQKAWFRAGLDRVRRGNSKGFRVCLLCSEGKPEACHRTKLVSESLVHEGVAVLHIDADGSLVSHESVMHRLDEPQQSLGFIDVVGQSTGRYSAR